MSYCVYLKRRQALPAEPVARLISSIPGLSLADGQQLVRRCRGFLIEHLEPEAAATLVRQLKDLSVDAECRQMRDLIPNPRPVLVHGGSFQEEGCTVQDWKSQDSSLQWEDIALLSVSCLKELEVPDSLRKKLRKETRTRPAAEAPEHKEKQVYLLDFYATQPRCHYRILSTEFRYDYLGGRLQGSSVANFSSMLHDFHKHATLAHSDEGFIAALDGHWQQVPSYTAIYEVDEYHRWLLQTCPAGGEGEPGRASSKGFFR